MKAVRQARLELSGGSTPDQLKPPREDNEDQALRDTGRHFAPPPPPPPNIGTQVKGSVHSNNDVMGQSRKGMCSLSLLLWPCVHYPHASVDSPPPPPPNSLPPPGGGGGGAAPNVHSAKDGKIFCSGYDGVVVERFGLGLCAWAPRWRGGGGVIWWSFILGILGTVACSTGTAPEGIRVRRRCKILILRH